MFIDKNEAKKYAFQPYEPCPCESGAKYKFCCYEKSKTVKKEYIKYSAGRLMAEGNKYYKNSNFKTCYGFENSECNHKFVRAHSLQNNGVLDQIAVNNHVSQFVNDIDKDTLIPSLKFELVGKKEASTFYGFCQVHDKNYFTCIEDREYTGTSEQHFAYAFRAHCLEDHKKKRLLKVSAAFYKDFPEATRNEQLQQDYVNTKLSLRDNAFDYTRFKDIYETNDFDRLETFSRIIPIKSGFAATTSVGVGKDMNGNMAADVYNYDENLFIPSLYLSVIPRKNDTLILITRFKEDECYEGIIQQAREASDIRLQQYISFCLSEYSENVYYSPEIVDKLSDSEISLLGKKFYSSITPFYPDRVAHVLTSELTSFNLFEIFEASKK